MKVLDLDGNSSVWKLVGYKVLGDDTRPRSNLHLAARAVIHELFPMAHILEEVAIKTRSTRTQYIDFYIHSLRLAIEVNGQQHYKFNKMFHTSAQDFLNQKKNDNDKTEWCAANNLTQIILSYKDDPETWKQQIINR